MTSTDGPHFLAGRELYQTAFTGTCVRFHNRFIKPFPLDIAPAMLELIKRIAMAVAAIVIYPTLVVLALLGRSVVPASNSNEQQSSPIDAEMDRWINYAPAWDYPMLFTFAFRCGDETLSWMTHATSNIDHYKEMATLFRIRAKEIQNEQPQNSNWQMAQLAIWQLGKDYRWNYESAGSQGTEKKYGEEAALSSFLETSIIKVSDSWKETLRIYTLDRLKESPLRKSRTNAMIFTSPRTKARDTQGRVLPVQLEAATDFFTAWIEYTTRWSAPKFEDRVHGISAVVLDPEGEAITLVGAKQSLAKIRSNPSLLQLPYKQKNALISKPIMHIFLTPARNGKWDLQVYHPTPLSQSDPSNPSEKQLAIVPEALEKAMQDQRIPPKVIQSFKEKLTLIK